MGWFQQGPKQPTARDLLRQGQKAGLGVRQLARVCGLSPAYVSRILSGERDGASSLDRIQAAAQAGWGTKQPKVKPAVQSGYRSENSQPKPEKDVPPDRRMRRQAIRAAMNDPEWRAEREAEQEAELDALRSDDSGVSAVEAMGIVALGMYLTSQKAERAQLRESYQAARDRGLSDAQAQAEILSDPATISRQLAKRLPQRAPDRPTATAPHIKLDGSYAAEARRFGVVIPNGIPPTLEDEARRQLAAGGSYTEDDVRVRVVALRLAAHSVALIPRRSESVTLLGQPQTVNRHGQRHGASLGYSARATYGVKSASPILGR